MIEIIEISTFYGYIKTLLNLEAPITTAADGI